MLGFLILCPVKLEPFLMARTVPAPHSPFTFVVHAGKNLQAQYERWQPRAKYKMHLDPTVDDAKRVAVSCRRAAKVRLASLSRRTDLLQGSWCEFCRIVQMSG